MVHLICQIRFSECIRFMNFFTYRYIPNMKDAKYSIKMVYMLLRIEGKNKKQISSLKINHSLQTRWNEILVQYYMMYAIHAKGRKRKKGRPYTRIWREGEIDCQWNNNIRRTFGSFLSLHQPQARPYALRLLLLSSLHLSIAEIHIFKSFVSFP